MERLAYRVEEVAEAIGLSRKTIYREIQRGNLEAVRTERTYLITPAALDAYLSNK